VPPARAYALVGGTIHPVSGPDEVGGTLVIRDGRITEILSEGAPPPDDCMIVDVRGLHVYPGLINAATRVGIQEIEAIPVTMDLGEVGRFQPDVFSLSAFNPHSRLLGVARDGGVLAANVIPAGPIVAGQSGLVHLAGWTLNEMVQLHASGLVVRIPSIPPRPIVEGAPQRGPGDRRGREENVRKRQAELRDFFENAQRYAAGRAADPAKWPYDPRYEQMRPYVTRTRPVMFVANTYKEILEALMFAEQMDVAPIILGGRQAWRLAELLAEKEVPVIYEGVMELPEQFEPWDANYRAASVMDEAGVEFCFAHGDADLAKQLASEAGWAVAHGLSPETALHAITLAPAEILGVDDELGSLDVGKLANVLVTTDDILQVSHRIVHAFVRGEPVPVDSAHALQAHMFVDRPAPALPPARDDLNGSPSQSTR
jgi:imidazolonepropionase-like amidohydrolase